MTALADLTAEQRAALAARLITELGMPAVRRHLAPTRIAAPPPGTAVLACRCGRPLDLHQMRRPAHALPAEPGAAPRIDPITCQECAS